MEHRLTGKGNIPDDRLSFLSRKRIMLDDNHSVMLNNTVYSDGIIASTTAASIRTLADEESNYKEHKKPKVVPDNTPTLLHKPYSIVI